MECPDYLEWGHPETLAGGGHGSYARRNYAGGAWHVFLAVQSFACRHCHKLAYACQQEAHHDRVARPADIIRRRLGWETGILNSDGWKPNGMHWRTFERLKAEHDACANATWGGHGQSDLAARRPECPGPGVDRLRDVAGQRQLNHLPCGKRVLEVMKQRRPGIGVGLNRLLQTRTEPGHGIFLRMGLMPTSRHRARPCRAIRLRLPARKLRSCRH